MQRPRGFCLGLDFGVFVFNEYFRKGTLKSTTNWQARQRKKGFKVNLGTSAKAQQKVYHLQHQSEKTDLHG